MFKVNRPASADALASFPGGRRAGLVVDALGGTDRRAFRDDPEGGRAWRGRPAEEGGEPFGAMGAGPTPFGHGWKVDPAPVTPSSSGTFSKTTAFGTIQE